MPFQRGNTYGNRKGRPRKGDSLAEAIRSRWKPESRRKAIDAIAKKAEGGDLMAFTAFARHGWPDEAKGELVLTTDPQRPPVIIHKHVD